MNSKYLEQFLRVAEMGSINKAAVELKISQPSLSRNVSLLEYEMGTELFVRSRSGVRLTEAGKLLFDQARPLLRQFTVLREQIGKMAHGQVAVGIPPSWRAVLTTEFAEEVVREDDDIQIRVNENVSHALREQLTAGVVDMCIAPAERNSNPDFKQTPIVKEPLALVGNADAGLDETNPVPLQTLDGLPLVIPPRPNAIRNMVEQDLAKRGIDLNVAMETDTLSLCLTMCERNAGYTVTPRCALLSNAHIQGITWAPIEGEDVTWALFENRKRTHSQAVRKCRKMLLARVSEKLAQGQWSGARKP